MTIKEMIQKVENYNEIAKKMASPDAKLTFKMYFGISFDIGSYNDFEKFVNDTFIANVAEGILKYPGYEFDKETVFPYEIAPGVSRTEKVEFDVFVKF